MALLIDRYITLELSKATASDRTYQLHASAKNGQRFGLYVTLTEDQALTINTAIDVLARSVAKADQGVA